LNAIIPPYPVFRFFVALNIFLNENMRPNSLGCKQPGGLWVTLYIRSYFTVNGIYFMQNDAKPLKNVVSELWTGGEAIIDPTITSIIEAWSKIVPNSLRSGMCLEGFREGTLHILVSNPVVGQQLQFQKEILREKLNALLRKPLIKGFRIKTGTFTPIHPTSA
jgi:hypothetical protein